MRPATRRARAGLDPVLGHQRQRPTRTKTCRAQAGGRSDQGQAHPGRFLRHRAEQARRLGVGLGARVPRLDRARRARRHHPPATALSEIYEPPLPGYSPRSLDLDSDGVAWVPLASGQMASFDRRKCKGPLNGRPEVPTSKQSRPRLDALVSLTRVPHGSATSTKPAARDQIYSTWVDQHNVLGLGKASRRRP